MACILHCVDVSLLAATGRARWPGPWSMPMNEGEVEPEITECLRRLADAVSRLTEVAGQGPTTEPSIDLLTADELAERFRISARTIRDQAAAGQIPHHRFGKHYRFSNEDIDEILRQTKKAPRHRLRRPKGGRSAA